MLWYPVQYEGLESSANIIYTGSCLNQQIFPAVQWLKNMRKKRVFLIGSDYVYPHTANHVIKSHLLDTEVGLVKEIYFPLGATDFTSIRNAINESRPDIILNTINGDSNISFFREFNRAGFSAESLPVMSFSVAEQELENIDADTSGHLACWSYFQSLESKANRSFVRRFKSRFGEDRVVSDPILSAYMQLRFWKKTVESVKSFDVQKVLKGLVRNKVAGPAGEWQINDNNHVSKKAFIGKINREGQFDIIWESRKNIQPQPWLGLEELKRADTSLLMDLLSDVPDEIHKVWQMKYIDLAEQNRKLEKEMISRRQAEKELLHAKESLEEDVRARTSELLNRNRELEREIQIRQQAEEARDDLESRLRQGEKMQAIGQLAGGMAHDFNNMLGVIIGHAEMVLLQLDEDTIYSDSIKEILNAAERSAKLTKQLLAFARKQTLLPENLDLNQTLEGLLRMIKRLIGEHIELIWKPGEELSCIKADPSQIDQILVNLCVNARDAIKGTGTIMISTENVTISEEQIGAHPDRIAGNYVKISVADSGSGMDQQTLERIFEPFFTTKGHSGTGLGLSSVYGSVQQSDGFIDVKSVVGEGTVFQVFFPVSLGAGECIKETFGSSGMESGHETILVVEDEPANLELTKLMLLSMGYDVLSSHSPVDALNRVKRYEGTIDLLIADVIMPEMNGYDLMKAVSQIRPNIRHLFISGYTDNIIESQVDSDQNLQFLQKPFLMKKLSKAVRSVLDTERG